MKSDATGGASRRAFLAQTPALVSLGLGSGLALASTRPSDRIGIGMIGVGGRGSDHLHELIRLSSAQNVAITAVCDVWRKARETAAQTLKRSGAKEPKPFSRFGELLEQPDVDAVVIATPDFSHGTILAAALKAKKDVYVEKPMTIDLASAAHALELARSGERVVQVGTQRRSEGHFRAAAKLVASGDLGKINRVSASVAFNEPRWRRDTSDCIAADVDWEAFLLNLPRRPFDPGLLRQWQLYRETSNGLPGLWMTHFADAVHLVTGASFPDRAVALGGTYVWKDGREHTDTFEAVLQYPEGFLFDWGMGLGNAAGGHFRVHGTKATLDLNHWTVQSEEKGEKARTVPVERSTSHMENWLDCLRTRRRPNADIEFGYQHVVATVMAAQALETGRRQAFDAGRRTILAS
jgi:predicted dehydrogenase